ncbi:hypothetical protein, partial [Rhizobium johnstonii]|uniref:hypothetical protein n=1 Tax=Rhizobium johnstonii TaxID=3019933 RepID=UPI003F9C82C3
LPEDLPSLPSRAACPRPGLRRQELRANATQDAGFARILFSALDGPQILKCKDYERTLELRLLEDETGIHNLVG